MKFVSDEQLDALFLLKPTSRISRDFLERAKVTLKRKKDISWTLRHFWEYDLACNLLEDIEKLEKTMTIY